MVPPFVSLHPRGKAFEAAHSPTASFDADLFASFRPSRVFAKVENEYDSWTRFVGLEFVIMRRSVSGIHDVIHFHPLLNKTRLRNNHRVSHRFISIGTNVQTLENLSRLLPPPGLLPKHRLSWQPTRSQPRRRHGRRRRCAAERVRISQFATCTI
jgi:hypothetical protein